MFKRLFLLIFLVCFAFGFLLAGPPKKPPVQKTKPPAISVTCPDLVITSMEFRDLKPTSYKDKVCWTFKVYFVIANNGKVDSGPFTWRLEHKDKGGGYSSKMETKMPGLAPNCAMPYLIPEAPWCSDTPPPFFKLTIDFYNEVTECNENNNSIEKQFAKPSLPKPQTKKK